MKVDVLLLLLSLSTVHCAQQLHKAFIPKSSVKWFSQLMDDEPGFDLWRLKQVDSKLNTTFDFQAEFRTKDSTFWETYAVDFESRGIKTSVLRDDLEKLHVKKTRSIPSFNDVVGRFAGYEDIINWMWNLSLKYPKLVQLADIGRTRFGNQLVVLQLSPAKFKRSSKKLIFFESGIHAREWISIATSVYMIDRLIQDFIANDLNTIKIFQQFDIHFLVLTNPDGYRYSWNSANNRLWRKNLRSDKNHNRTGCYGVDLNRNFDSFWMVSGSSSNACSETYAGTHAASEFETAALQNYILSKSQKWIAYFSLHSYGAFWMTPYSYSKKRILENFMDSCGKSLTAIKKMQKQFFTKTHKIENAYGERVALDESVHNVEDWIKSDEDYFAGTYKFDSSAHALYESSGGSDDWARLVARIPFSYVLELRPSDKDANHEGFLGFLYPESKIIESAEEIFFGLKEYFLLINRNSYSSEINEKCKEILENIKSNSDSAILSSHPPEEK